MTKNTHRTYCRFCVALCGLEVTVDNAEVIAVRGDPQHAGSNGYTCFKGRNLGSWHHHPQRLHKPQIRSATGLQDVSWTDCINDLGTKISEAIAISGPDAVGVYLATASAFDASGRWASERLTKAINSRSKYTSTSIDTPCKPLVSTLMSGFPGLVPMIDEKDVTLSIFVGCNPVVSHGHLNSFSNPIVRLKALATNPREMWVIDPRETESSRISTRHLAPRSGTDFALFAAVIRYMLKTNQGLDAEYIERHTHLSDMQTLAAAVEPWTFELAQEISGCPQSAIQSLAETIIRHRRLAIQTGTGSTMSPSANITEWLIWVLHVLTGSYDQPGGMWFQPGVLRQLQERVAPNHATPSSKPGPKSRPELRIWTDEYPCSAMIDEIESGNLRVLIVFGGNPINSFPDANATHAAFKKLDALAVLDVVSTDTTEIATHIMPTKGQLERADIPFFVDQFNSDMSTQFTDAVVEPTPDMRSMWWITEQIAISCGTSILPTTLSSESSDKDVLAHIAHRSAVDFDQLQSERYMTVARPFGWVVNKLLPEGKWRICPEQISDQLINYPTSTATSNPQYPFRLISQRQPKHLNSQHMLPLDAPNMDKPGLLIHSETATNLQLAEGDSVLISSPVGSLQAKIIYQNTLRPECVVFPHGWNTPSVSHLTSYKKVDPLTGMVIQTSIPVSLTKVSC